MASIYNFARSWRRPSSSFSYYTHTDRRSLMMLSTAAAVSNGHKSLILFSAKSHNAITKNVFHSLSLNCVGLKGFFAPLNRENPIKFIWEAHAHAALNLCPHLSSGFNSSPHDSNGKSQRGACHSSQYTYSLCIWCNEFILLDVNSIQSFLHSLSVSLSSTLERKCDIQQLILCSSNRTRDWIVIRRELMGEINFTFPEHWI